MWVNGFILLLKGHVLLLPEIERVLVCTWTGKTGEAPHILMLGAEGGAVLVTDGLENFSLIKP